MTPNLLKVISVLNYSRGTKKNQRTMIQCDHGGQETKKTSKKAPGNGIFSDVDDPRPYIYIYIYKYILYIYIYMYIYILLLKTTRYNIWKNILVKEQLSFWRSDLPRRYSQDKKKESCSLGAKSFTTFSQRFV